MFKWRPSREDKMKKEYLGDSVYVDFDGFAVVLTTERSPDAPSNTIYMEPVIIKQFQKYIARLKKELKGKKE